jgi:hypothetical protein
MTSPVITPAILTVTPGSFTTPVISPALLSVKAGTFTSASISGVNLALTPGSFLPDASITTVPLGSTWSFQEDPTNIGVTNGWFQPSFNVSGWPTILSGQSWESQFPGHYSGYAWYSQVVPINLPFFGQWVVVSLGNLNGDIAAWWNGTQIGQITGQYQYNNLAIVSFYVPPSLIQASNTLAVRCWGGNLDQINASGLISGTTTLSLASNSPLWVRPTGGTLSQEVPMGAYDLSAAQNGATFDVVIRVQSFQITGNPNPYITYALVSLYDGTLISGGIAAIIIGSDGIYRSIIPVGAAAAVQVYLSGNVSVQWNVINYVPGPMTDTGQQIVVNSGSGTSYTMEIWSQTWAAGTVTLPPDGSSLAHGFYIPIIPNGVGLSNLVVDDNLLVGGIPDSTYWSFETNLQVGSLVSGDRTYTIQTLPSLVNGMQFIQTSQNSKFYGGSPPLQGPMATFTIDSPTTIYLAIDTRVIPALWNPSGQIAVVQQTPQNSVTFHMQFYGQFIPAGGTVVLLPPDGNGADHGMYFVAITDNTVVISNLIVYDDLIDEGVDPFTPDSQLWSVQTNLQAGNLYCPDRTYTFQSIPTYWQGAQWIQTPQNSKAFAGNPKGIGPMAQFTVSKACWVWLVVDTRVPVPGAITSSAAQMSFAARDAMQLPALSPVVHETTPFGSLQLIDRITCSTPTISETHPYMQGGFGGTHKEDFRTPGLAVQVNVETILGQGCREIDYGFFAYRIGAGALVPGKQYVLACTYPEDVPRYAQLEIQAGQGYFDVGWKNGLGSSNVYDPWPTSGAWQTFYQIFSLGTQTTGTGGAQDGNAVNGVWVYFLGKVSLPNSYWSIYTGGTAVGTISLYAIDPVANAPVINLPTGLPQRILTFDWERPATQPPADLCNYAKLMGYNTISPLIGMKWGTQHFGPPLAGYQTSGVDPENYPWLNPYTKGSGIPPPPLFAGVSSWHEQFLTQTAAVGINYIPRFEYGGSYDLPQSAWATSADGTFAKPNRYPSASPYFSANLVNSAVKDELQAFFNSFVQPFTGHSNFKGLLWRIRRDTLQISYGAADIAAFTAATGNTPPGGLNAQQLASWASTGSIQPLYATWWHGVRAAFHASLVTLLKTYRSDLIVLYYNWDVDKFSMLLPDLNSATFYGELNSLGGATAYGNDLTTRETYTATTYTTTMHNGNFESAVLTVRPDALWPDYGIRPSLYSFIPGFRIFCPVNYNAYALPDYINYFQTADGVAVSHAVSYDEIAAREPNPKYEGTMQVPGGGPFSMALEVQAWAYSNVNTLTWTSYTFGRGFSDYHRAFAQAFIAIPDIPATTIGGMPSNVTVRTYPSTDKTYIGVANTALTSQSLSLSIPGSWPQNATITNLVTNVQTTVSPGSTLPLAFTAAPMQLNAFLVTAGSGPPPPPSGGQGGVTLLGIDKTGVSS